MAAKPNSIIAMMAEVNIAAAEVDVEGKATGPRKFDVVAYTGGAMQIFGYDAPVVVDLDGLSFGKSLIANLDHDRSKRVGHVTEKSKADGQLRLGGIASAATPAREEVINSAIDGFVWQASIEAQPTKLVEVESGKTVTVNGQEFAGPLYVARKSVLKGFAFVSHGADDNTTVAIAASAADSKEKKMDADCKAWIEGMGFTVADLSADQLAGLVANFQGKPAPKSEGKSTGLDAVLDAKKLEAERQEKITEIAANACDKRPYHIDDIRALATEAVEKKWTVDKFRLEMLEAMVPTGVTINSISKPKCNDRIIEAAICRAGRLNDIDKYFDDQTLDASERLFRSGIGIKQLLIMGAEANGYRAMGGEVNIDVQRAAFGMAGPRHIHASGGFSTLSIPNVLAATANKFLRQGWMAVDQTPLRVAAIRSVRDFKQITTVSLTGDLSYEKIGASGEIKHGTLGEETYTNQADTYARMLAITRKDIINDDLSALTSVPMRLGRGAMLKLNDIFWTEFLDNSAFFASGNSNVNEGVADMTIGGLTATETIFLNQTDPDGKPLGVMPSILLVPTALKATAAALMDQQSKIVSGSTTGISDVNVFRGRFSVESSPYMSNTSYTGYSAAAWYMLANPAELPVIEIAALNGRVEPTVETADADFNVLGIQMRGYSDVGVNLQEYRGGVRADGGAS